jgi:DNA-binding XRE family transcriptional regulator
MRGVNNDPEDRRHGEAAAVIDLSEGRPALVGLGPESAGEALRLLRYRTRLTRDELAARVGVSAGAISNYENDVSAPTAVTLRRLTAAFAELLGRDAPALWEQLGAVLDRQERING